MLKWFHEEWLDLGIEWKNRSQGFTPDNWVDIGYEYHNYPDKKPVILTILVVSKHNPTASQHDFETQIQFTNLLISRLRSKGCEPQFNGFFDEYLS